METVSNQYEFLNMQSGTDYVLTDDISLEGAESADDPIVGDLSNSTIYGRGHEVKNFNGDFETGSSLPDNYAIIGSASGVTIKNLTIRNFLIDFDRFSPSYVSVLIASVDGDVIVENIHFENCDIYGDNYTGILFSGIYDEVGVSKCSFLDCHSDSGFDFAGIVCADSPGLTFDNYGPMRDLSFKDCTVDSTEFEDGGGRTIPGALFVNAPRPLVKRLYVDCDLGSDEYIYSSQANAVDSESNYIEDVYYNEERVTEDEIYIDSRFRSGDASLKNIAELTGEQVNNSDTVLRSNLDDIGMDDEVPGDQEELTLRDISVNFDYDDVWIELLGNFPLLRRDSPLSNSVFISGMAVAVSTGTTTGSLFISGEGASFFESKNDRFVSLSGSDFGY